MFFYFLSLLWPWRQDWWKLKTSGVKFDRFFNASPLIAEDAGLYIKIWVAYHWARQYWARILVYKWPKSKLFHAHQFRLERPQSRYWWEVHYGAYCIMCLSRAIFVFISVENTELVTSVWIHYTLSVQKKKKFTDLQIIYGVYRG